MNSNPHNIILLDSQTLFAQCFIKAMSSQFAITHIDHINQMRLHLLTATPQLIIFDPHGWPDNQGLPILDELLNYDVRVLILNNMADDTLQRACYYIGAHGFVDKSSHEAEFLLAMQIVLHNGLAYSNELIDKVCKNPAESLPMMRKTELGGIKFVMWGRHHSLQLSNMREHFFIRATYQKPDW